MTLQMKIDFAEQINLSNPQLRVWVFLLKSIIWVENVGYEKQCF
jgi:hypothetical protein